MKKSRLISYSIVLLASALMFGCTTSDRVEKTGSIIDNPQDQLPNNGGSFINDQNQTNDSGNITNDDNATTGTIKIDAKNAYKINVTMSDEYNQKGYYSKNEVGQLNFNIKNLYTNELVDTSIIDNITLEAEEKDSDTQGKFFNFITYSGEEGPTFNIPKEAVKATDSVAIKMKDLSGTTNIILSASVKLKDGSISAPYKLKIPLVIEKNKSSSMAIVPYEAKYENGLFINKFVIHVVDSYGNRAKDGTRISTGVINNPKLYSNSYDININNYLDDRGTLDKNSSTFTLPANSIDTNKEIITNYDTLITLANRDQHKPINLGGWDITSINSNQEVSIVNFDQGNNVTDVSYVIGNEYRYDSCKQTLMNAAASTFESTEVKDGLAYAELRYVPSMVGKTVFIYANTRLEDERIGISRRVPLTGLGLKPVTISCTNDEGKHPTCNKTVTMVQNGSEDFSRVSTIAYPINSGDAISANISVANGSVTNCAGNLHVNISNIDENKTATYTFGVIATENFYNQK